MIATKRALRARVNAAVHGLPAAEVEAQSLAACAVAASHSAFRAARSIVIFLSMPTGEVHTDALLRSALDRHVRVFVPRVSGPRPEDMSFLQVDGDADVRSFPRSRWGVPEPSEAYTSGEMRPVWPPVQSDSSDAQNTVIVVPGLAFDSSGARLGRGRGYYDVAITRARAHCAATGLQAPFLLVRVRVRAASAFQGRKLKMTSINIVKLYLFVTLACPTRHGTSTSHTVTHEHHRHPQGLCLKCQILPLNEIPMTAQDCRVDAVATPEGVINCSVSSIV